jgi:hypothetical protein
MPGHNDVTHYGSSRHGVRSPEFDDAWQDFICGICDRPVHGLVVSRSIENEQIAWLMCPRCGAPHAFVYGHTSPAPKPGRTVEGLPEEVAQAYDEARLALGAGSPTGCELICRKILMHAAVDKAGAQPGQKFVEYVDALEAAGLLTPPMRPWVDQIRQRANLATHEIPNVDQDRAENTLEFTAMLLWLVYETEHQTKRHATP